VKNCTWLTVPSLSAALAESAMVAGAVTMAPLLGLVMLTVGATLAWEVREIAPLVVTAPLLSVALAVTE